MQIPGIDGNIVADGLEKFIQIQSLDFESSRKIHTAPGNVTDRETKSPSMGEVVITKVVDQTTPHLFSEATVGTNKDQVVFKFVKTGKDLQDYLTVTLHNVMVSHYKLSHEDADENNTENQHGSHRPVEKIAFNYTKIELKYTPFDSQGNPGSPVPAGYDLETTKAA